MTPRKATSRLYQRNGRYWADLRDYGDVGGKREPLRAPGERVATADETTAHVLLARRLEQLDALRRGLAVHGARGVTVGTFATAHLVAKARAGKTTRKWMEAAEQHLKRACEFFGTDRELATIGVEHVRHWADHLATLAGRRGETMRGGTIRHHLNTLSNLYRRAQAEGRVLPGYNPVAAWMEKPIAPQQEARWLEVHDGALLLEAARMVVPLRPDLACPFLYPLIGTYLLTGGRLSEVLGLEVADVSFDRKTVTFRPNDWRRLKTQTSWRSVPLWPQLEAILRPHVFRADRPPSRLLFPSPIGEREALLTSFRKLLDRVSVRAGWQAGEITSKMLRHTYCSARLQTLDRGAPVSPFTVARELGHGGTRLVDRIYGHLGQLRHRAEVVEYRVEQHRAVLEDRLRALSRASADTNIGTVP